jgi:hypothetical protein
MEATRHNKTLKRTNIDTSGCTGHQTREEKAETFKNLLEDSAREAYSRPWHRLERGLRLNRLRLYVEDISPLFDLTKEEKEIVFIYLQKAHDKKLLNTLKIVQYDQTQQKIVAIKGLEIKRNNENNIKITLSQKKAPTDTTRKKKKSDENE